jgi:hypothetical protein
MLFSRRIQPLDVSRRLTKRTQFDLRPIHVVTITLDDKWAWHPNLSRHSKNGGAMSPALLWGYEGSSHPRVVSS